MNEKAVEFCRKCRTRPLLETKRYVTCPRCHSQLEYVTETRVIDDTLIVIGDIEGHYVIPDGVRNISGDPFSNTSISGITIPKTVTNIYYKMFYNCKELQKIIIEGDLEVYYGAFAGCSEVKEVVFNGIYENTKLLGKFWESFEELKRIVLPEGIKKLMTMVFLDSRV